MNYYSLGSFLFYNTNFFTFPQFFWRFDLPNQVACFWSWQGMVESLFYYVILSGCCQYHQFDLLVSTTSFKHLNIFTWHLNGIIMLRCRILSDYSGLSQNTHWWCHIVACVKRLEMSEMFQWLGWHRKVILMTQCLIPCWFGKYIKEGIIWFVLYYIRPIHIR